MYDTFIFDKDPNKLQRLENRLLVQKVCYKYLDNVYDKVVNIPPESGTYLAEIFPNVREIYGLPSTHLPREVWSKSNTRICQCLSNSDDNKCCISLVVAPCSDYANGQREAIYDYLNFIYKHRSTLSTFVFYNNGRKLPTFYSKILNNNQYLKELGGLVNYFKQFQQLKTLKISRDAFDYMNDMIPIFKGCKSLETLYIDQSFSNKQQAGEFIKMMSVTIPSVTKLHWRFAVTLLFPNIRELKMVDGYSSALKFWKEMNIVVLEELLKLSYSLDTFELCFTISIPSCKNKEDIIIPFKNAIRSHFMMDTEDNQNYDGDLQQSLYDCISSFPNIRNLMLMLICLEEPLEFPLTYFDPVITIILQQVESVKIIGEQVFSFPTYSAWFPNLKYLTIFNKEYSNNDNTAHLIDMQHTELERLSLDWTTLLSITQKNEFCISISRKNQHDQE